MQAKPFVKLVGEDGNAFAILGRCINAAKKAKWTPEQISQFKTEATSGDYDHLLLTVLKYFEEESTIEEIRNSDDDDDDTICGRCGWQECACDEDEEE